MKLTASLTALLALSLAAPLAAQPACYIQHLRGSYLGNTTGWIDASSLNPGAPSTMVPMSCVGSHKFDGAGGGTITMACNINGTALGGQATITATKLSEDCSGTMEATLKVPNTPISMPLIVRFFMVPGGEELHLISIGKAVWSEQLRRVGVLWQ